MAKNYNFSIYTDILYALDYSNKTMPNSHFNILDASILCLIKSFNDKKQQFYMSNKELSTIFLSDPTTIQRSLKRLTSSGLVTSRKEHNGKTPRRYLSYNKEVIDSLVFNIY